MNFSFKTKNLHHIPSNYLSLRLLCFHHPIVHVSTTKELPDEPAASLDCSECAGSGMGARQCQPDRRLPGQHPRQEPPARAHHIGGHDLRGEAGEREKDFAGQLLAGVRVRGHEGRDSGGDQRGHQHVAGRRGGLHRAGELVRGGGDCVGVAEPADDILCE